MLQVKGAEAGPDQVQQTSHDGGFKHTSHDREEVVCARHDHDGVVRQVARLDRFLTGAAR